MALAKYNGQEANITRPVAKAITSSTDATPIVVRAIAHGLRTGDAVLVYDHGVNVAANGEWIVDKLTDNDVALRTSVGSGAGAGGATGSIIGLGVLPPLSLPSDAEGRTAGNTDIGPEGNADAIAYAVHRLGMMRMVGSSTPGIDVTEPPGSLVTWNQAAYTAGNTLIAQITQPLAPGDVIFFTLALSLKIANGTGDFYVKARRSFDGGATIADMASGSAKTLFSVLGGELNTYRAATIVGWDVIPAATRVSSYRLYLIGRSTSAAPQFDLMGNSGAELRAWRAN